MLFRSLISKLASTKEIETDDGTTSADLHASHQLDKIYYDLSGYEYMKSHIKDNIPILDYKVSVEWLQSTIYIRVRPAYPHELASNAFDSEIAVWLHNNGNGDKRALWGLGSAGTFDPCPTID